MPEPSRRLRLFLRCLAALLLGILLLAGAAMVYVQHNSVAITHALLEDFTQRTGLHLHVRSIGLSWLPPAVQTDDVRIRIKELDISVRTARLRPRLTALLQGRLELEYVALQNPVLSGSLPPACPADYYRTVMERIARKNVRCVLDADGLRLRAGLEAKPFLVKPNRDELEELTGEPLRTLDDIARAARGLIERGVGIAAVSLGAEGALIADEHDVYCAPRLEIPVRSTVGAGDAMCAGLCAGLARGGSLEEIFRLGMACSGAAVMSEGTRPIERAECEKLLSRVQIRRL